MFFEFFIAVEKLDTNANILIEFSRLRGINATFSSGDHICRSLASTIDAIADAITRSHGALYDIASYRERKRQEYVDRLNYNTIKKLK